MFDGTLKIRLLQCYEFLWFIILARSVYIYLLSQIYRSLLSLTPISTFWHQKMSLYYHSYLVFSFDTWTDMDKIHQITLYAISRRYKISHQKTSVMWCHAGQYWFWSLRFGGDYNTCSFCYPHCFISISLSKVRAFKTQLWLQYLPPKKESSSLHSTVVTGFSKPWFALKSFNFQDYPLKIL